MSQYRVLLENCTVITHASSPRHASFSALVADPHAEVFNVELLEADTLRQYVVVNDSAVGYRSGSTGPVTILANDPLGNYPHNGPIEVSNKDIVRNARLADIVHYHLPSPRLYVIYSPNEDHAHVGAGFWSNEGWTHLDQASIFSEEQQHDYALPISMGNDAKFVPSCTVLAVRK